MTSMPQSVEIDLRSIESLEQLHILFQARFNFPHFYGRNWDAFWDAITGLVVLPSRVRLLGWASFESRFPRDARIMRECFSDYQRELGKKASEIEFT